MENKKSIEYTCGCCNETRRTKQKYTKYPYEISVGKIFCDKIGDEMLTVTNPFSGEKYRLTGIEESIYSIIMGAQFMPHYMTSPTLQKDVRKGLDWFRANNAEAYMKLLD